MSLDGLSAPERILYQLIAEAAAAGAPTPRVGELQAGLVARGHPASRNLVEKTIDRLARAELILRDRREGRRVYGLPGNWRWTVPVLSFEELARRETAGRRPADSAEGQSAGWPRPTAESIAAYDRAMALKPFAPAGLALRPAGGRRQGC